MPPQITNQQLPHTKRFGASSVGRSIAYVTCPFCGVETMCYIWSLAGSGKKCPCGAKHSGQGYTTRPAPAGATDEVAQTASLAPETGEKA